MKTESLDRPIGEPRPLPETTTTFAPEAYDAAEFVAVIHRDPRLRVEVIKDKRGERAGQMLGAIEFVALIAERQALDPAGVFCSVNAGTAGEHVVRALAAERGTT